MPTPDPSDSYVFLSHSSKDKNIVNLIAGKLKSRGITVWLDTESVSGGEYFERKITQAMRNAKASVILYGTSGLGPWQKKEVSYASLLDTQNQIPVIVVLLPNVAEKDFREDDAIGFSLHSKSFIKFNSQTDKAAIDSLVNSLKNATNASPGLNVSSQPLPATPPERKPVNQIPKPSPAPVSVSQTSPNNQLSRPLVSPPLTRQKFLKWAVPAGVGLVGVAISSQFLGHQPSVDTVEGFLKAGKWKEADYETVKLMRKVANPGKDQLLTPDSLSNFPCEVLSKIDRLWVEYSNGRFGFSVQKKIYIEDCQGKLGDDEHAWLCLGKKVGWYVNGDWIMSLNYSTQAPIGHLPGGAGELRCEGGVYWQKCVADLLYRVEVCRL